MRDPDRIPEILTVLEQIWKISPDMRLCQILVNATNCTGDMFYIEDHKLLKDLIKLRDREKMKKLSDLDEALVNMIINILRYSNDYLSEEATDEELQSIGIELLLDVKADLNAISKLPSY